MVVAVGAVLASAAGRCLFPLPLVGHGGISAGSQVHQTPELLVLWPGRQTQLFGKWLLPCLFEWHGDLRMKHLTGTAGYQTVMHAHRCLYMPRQSGWPQLPCSRWFKIHMRPAHRRPPREP